MHVQVFLLLQNFRQVFITPTTKNNTSNANAIACTAPCIFVITFQIVPPLKSTGDCDISVHISLNFEFHVSIAFCRFPTTQFNIYHPLISSLANLSFRSISSTTVSNFFSSTIFNHLHIPLNQYHILLHFPTNPNHQLFALQIILLVVDFLTILQFFFLFHLAFCYVLQLEK